MFIGVYEDTLDNNKIHNYIYYYKGGKLGWAAWNSDTFSPYTNIIGVLDLKVKGNTYQERKNNLEDLAKDWQLHFSNFSWSWGEIAEITNYFYDMAKRFGLVKEFKENGII